PEQLRYTIGYNSYNFMTNIMEPGGRYLSITWTNFVPSGGSSSISVIQKVSTSDGRYVIFTYTNLPAIAPYTALASATYSDGTTANYRYIQMAVGNHRPLLAEAQDTRYAGTANHIKYEYWEMTNGTGGQVFRELNGETDEEIARFGAYSTNYYTSDMVTNAVTYANGGVQNFVFQGQNHAGDYGDKLLWKTDALGNKTSYGYSDGGNGFMIAETNALGQVTRFGRDSLGRILAQTNADNSTRYFTYDSVGRILTSTDELNRVTTWTRDSLGRVTQITYPDNTTEGFGYNVFNQVNSHTNRNGSVEKQVYLSNGRLKTQTDALGGVITYTYTDANLPASISNSLKQVVRFAYNDRGQVTLKTNADGTILRYGYDAWGNRTAITNELGNVTLYTYDEFKRLISVTDPLNRTTTYSYDFALPGGGSACGCANTKNNPSLIVNPSGQATAFLYDLEWRRTGVIRGYGTSDAATNQTVYDAAGNLVTSIDPNGQSWSYTYDNRNRRITASDPLGRTTTWTNDVAGRVAAQVAPDNTATFYGYDLMDRRIAETNALNQITLYGFDVSGNLTSLTDANNNVTQWSYDLLNRQISKIYADSTHDDYGYDALGNLKTQTNASGQVATHSYDKQNRLTNSVWSGGSAPTVTRSYDALGRLIKLNNGNVTLGYAYDAANQLLAETNVISGNTFITGYGYDLDGRKQTLIYPSGNMVTNTFTARGQLQEIYANTPPPLATFAYDLDGRRTSRALANGVTTVYDYD
ncbi:MAG: hypothetical protein ACTHKU_01795, partial [Verrucomicrobiota bacterium]